MSGRHPGLVSRIRGGDAALRASSVKLPPELWRQAKGYAAAQGWTLQELVAHALRRVLGQDGGVPEDRQSTLGRPQSVARASRRAPGKGGAPKTAPNEMEDFNT